MKSPEEQALQINTLEVMMEQNNKDHDAIKSMILSFGVKLDDSLERMERKFAAKWAEKALIWLFSCTGVVFIGLLVRWIVLVELK